MVNVVSVAIATYVMWTSANELESSEQAGMSFGLLRARLQLFIYRAGQKKQKKVTSFLTTSI